MTELALSPRRFLRPQSKNTLRILHDIMYCKHSDIIVSGPLGTSKSVTCFLALHMLCCMCEDLRVAVLRKEKSTLYSTVVESMRQMLAQGFANSPDQPFHVYGGERRPQSLYYHSGSEMHFGGLDDTAKILGLEINVAWMNQGERMMEAEYNDVSSRLRGLGGFDNPFTGRRHTLMLSDVNPQGPNHFMLKRRDDGTALMMPTLLQDNVGYFRNGSWTQAGLDYRERLEAAYPTPGYQRDRAINGLWVAASGLVIPQYDPDIHNVDMARTSIPKDYKWHASIDYGTTHPANYTVYAVAPDRKTVLAYKAIQRTGLTSSDLVPLIHELHRKHNLPTKIRAVGDYAGDGNKTLRRAGIPVADAKKDVDFGVDIMRQWFGGVDGRKIRINKNLLSHPPDPELISNSRPTNLMEELLEWAHLPAEKQTSGTIRDDLPDKRRGGDDACDSLRYELVRVESGGRIPSIIGTTVPPKAQSFFV